MGGWVWVNGVCVCGGYVCVGVYVCVCEDECVHVGMGVCVCDCVNMCESEGVLGVYV